MLEQAFFDEKMSTVRFLTICTPWNGAPVSFRLALFLNALGLPLAASACFQDFGCAAEIMLD